MQFFWKLSTSFEPTLESRFCQATGQTPLAYGRDLITEHARNLLERYRLPLPTKRKEFSFQDDDLEAKASVHEPSSGDTPIPISADRVDLIDRVTELEPVGAGAAELRELALHHSDPEVRKTSLDEISEGSEEVALNAFIAALEDDDTEVVEFSIKQLRFLDDRSAIPALEVLAWSHEEEEIRQLASEAIEFLE